MSFKPLEKGATDTIPSASESKPAVISTPMNVVVEAPITVDVHKIAIEGPASIVEQGAATGESILSTSQPGEETALQHYIRIPGNFVILLVSFSFKICFLITLISLFSCAGPIQGNFWAKSGLEEMIYTHEQGLPPMDFPLVNYEELLHQPSIPEPVLDLRFLVNSASS